jgi:hypothetical protein
VDWEWLVGKLDKIYTYSMYPNVNPSHLGAASQRQSHSEARKSAVARGLGYIEVMQENNSNKREPSFLS